MTPRNTPILDPQPGSSVQESKQIFRSVAARRGLLTYGAVGNIIGRSEIFVEALANGRIKPGRGARMIERAFNVPIWSTPAEFDATNRASELVGFDVGLAANEESIRRAAVKAGLLQKGFSGTREELIAYLAALPPETPPAPRPGSIPPSAAAPSDADFAALFAGMPPMEVSPEIAQGIQHGIQHFKAQLTPVAGE